MRWTRKSRRRSRPRRARQYWRPCLPVKSAPRRQLAACGVWLGNMDAAYLKILQMIQAGTISAEEGARLLDALGQGPQQAEQPADETSPDEGVAATAPAGPPSWARWAWVYPLAAGLGLLAIAGIFS